MSGMDAPLQPDLDHWDQAMMEHRVDLRLHALVRAIEALIAPDRGRTQGQLNTYSPLSSLGKSECLHGTDR
jgi:hypothetical protein